MRKFGGDNPSCRLSSTTSVRADESVEYGEMLRSGRELNEVLRRPSSLWASNEMLSTMRELAVDAFDQVTDPKFGAGLLRFRVVMGFSTMEKVLSGFTEMKFSRLDRATCLEGRAELSSRCVDCSCGASSFVVLLSGASYSATLYAGVEGMDGPAPAKSDKGFEAETAFPLALTNEVAEDEFDEKSDPDRDLR
jgi:hypothetical protein